MNICLKFLKDIDTMLNKIIEIKTNNPPGFDFCRDWISSSDEDLKS